MEEQIKRTAGQVKVLFACFWLLPILLIVLGEVDGGWVGIYADDVRATYYAEALTILLAAICVPVSLKLFSWMLVKKIDVVSLPVALRLYALWSGVRLFLLVLPVLSGLLTYYLSLSTKGVLCALLALTASFFCLPGEERMRKELHIDKV